MKEPVWIDVADVFSFQLELLATFGGLAGLRDEGLLDSALSRPQNRFAYGTPTLFELAAEYAVGIVKNHPFLDRILFRVTTNERSTPFQISSLFQRERIKSL